MNAEPRAEAAVYAPALAATMLATFDGMITLMTQSEEARK